MAHLHKVNQTYYFRIRIPLDIKPLFGREEFKRSLKTKSLTSARRLGILWAAKTERLFTTIRTGTLTNFHIKKLIEEYIGYTLRKDDEVRLAQGSSQSLCETDEGPIWISDRAEFDPDIETITEELGNNRYDSVSSLLDEFLQYKGVEIVKDSYQYKALCRDIALAHIDQIHQINVNRDMGIFTDEYYHPEQTHRADTQSTPEPEEEIITFSDLIEMYVDERKAKRDISMKSLREFQTRLALFQEMIGNPDVKSLNRKLFVDCLNKAVKLPPRRNIMPEYKGKSIDELLALNVPETLGVKTIRNHFSSLSTLLGWAEINDYIAKNPAQSLLPKDDRDEESRIPFEDSELQKMVTALSDNKDSLKPFRWWIPLVSLFSGLRADEVCQLYKEDIRKENDIWIFDVNAKDDKKVKTPNSKRLVPVHPQLIDLGFLQYVDSVKHERVWSELTRGSRGYSHNWTDWFSNFNREFISNDPRKVFHSLRKSFANNLKQNMIPEPVLTELLGHDRKSLAMSVYSNRYDVKVLYDEMQRLDYGLDLSGLN